MCPQCPSIQDTKSVQPHFVSHILLHREDAKRIRRSVILFHFADSLQLVGCGARSAIGRAASESPPNSFPSHPSRLGDFQPSSLVSECHLITAQPSQAPSGMSRRAVDATKPRRSSPSRIPRLIPDDTQQCSPPRDNVRHYIGLHPVLPHQGGSEVVTYEPEWLGGAKGPAVLCCNII